MEWIPRPARGAPPDRAVPIRHFLSRVTLTRDHLRHGATLGVALLIGLAAVMIVGTNVGDRQAVPDIIAAAPPVLDERGQREALRALGGALCRPGADRAERDGLRAELRISMDADDIRGFWTRAARDKPRAELGRAFFGCRSLTSWMRKRARVEGVDVAAIIARVSSEPDHTTREGSVGAGADSASGS